MSKLALLTGIVFACAVVVPLPAEAQTADASSAHDEGKKHFEAGVSLLQDPEGEKVEEAYREFRRAYDLTGSPKILGNMGYCAMRLERDGEAIDAYSRYLREVTDIDPDERAQIVRDVQTLSVGVTRLVLTATVPSTATVAVIDERVPVRGARVTNAYGPTTDKLQIGVRPGHHVFTAKVAGYQDAVWEMEAFAGTKDEHAFAMRVVEAPRSAKSGEGESRSSLGPILVLSAGGAMLVAGGITGIVALNKTSDIEDHCPGNVCPRSFDLGGARSSARTFVGVTDLLLLVGAVTTLGGLYWGYRTWWSAGEKAPPPASTKAASVLSDWRVGL